MEATMERDEAAILADLAAAQATYDKVVDTDTRDVVEAASGLIKDLKRELSAFLADGAKACPLCGVAPHGMLRTPAYTHRGVAVEAVYEVGCLADPVQFRGATPAEASARWNAWIAAVRARPVKAEA